MEFVTLPDRRAAEDPNGLALSDSAASLNNAEFLNAVRAVATRLHARGIGPGDVIALKLSNRVDFVVLLFAAWRLGATVTPVNPSLTPV